MSSAELLDFVARTLGPFNPDAPSSGYPTDAVDRVFTPGDWPTQPDQYPIIKLRLVGEQRQSLARGNLQFLTVAAVRIIAEVSEPVSIEDLGNTAIEASLWRLKRQIEGVIMNSATLFGHVQQIKATRAQFAFSAEAATHLAGLQIDMDLEFFEDGTDFDPPADLPLDRITARSSVSDRGWIVRGQANLVNEDADTLTDDGAPLST